MPVHDRLKLFVIPVDELECVPDAGSAKDLKLFVSAVLDSNQLHVIKLPTVHSASGFGKPPDSAAAHSARFCWHFGLVSVIDRGFRTEIEKVLNFAINPRHFATLVHVDERRECHCLSGDLLAAFSEGFSTVGNPSTM